MKRYIVRDSYGATRAIHANVGDIARAAKRISLSYGAVTVWWRDDTGKPRVQLATCVDGVLTYYPHTLKTV